MRSFLRPTTLLALFLLACCSGGTSPVGYDGPLPSDAAMAVFAELNGESFEDTSGALGGGTWIVTGFAVIPNARSGKSGVAMVESGDRRDFLPLLTDGDVADFYRRVRGESPANLSGDRSDDYRAIWR